MLLSVFAVLEHLERVFSNKQFFSRFDTRLGSQWAAHWMVPSKIKGFFLGHLAIRFPLPQRNNLSRWRERTGAANLTNRNGCCVPVALVRPRIYLPVPWICFQEAEYESASRRQNLIARTINLLPRGRIWLKEPWIWFLEAESGYRA